jgi:hypothetical protein
MKYKRIVFDDGPNMGIYIFVGDILKDNDLNRLYASNPDDKIFETVLSSNDRKQMKRNGNNVYFVDYLLYNDDTIETIKKKFITATDSSLTYDELYLFSANTITIDSQYIYQILSKNGKYDITHSSLMNFLANIEGTSSVVIPDIPIFAYNDIVDIALSGTYDINVPIGLEFHTENMNTTCIVDPYILMNVDKLTQQYYTNITSSADRSLLMEYGDLVNDTIYIRTVKSVIDLSSTRDIRSEVIFGLYFPLLYRQNISNIDLFYSNRDDLLQKTEEMIAELSWNRQDRTVKYLNNIYDNREYDIDYIHKGITGIKISIGGDDKHKLPIDNIFKLLNSSNEYPLIKYNPGKFQENIYRLYSDKKTITGDKIPFLSKSTIMELIKTIGIQSKSISLYSTVNFEGMVIEVIMFIYVTGMINISLDLVEPLGVPKINEIIHLSVDTIIHKINNYMEVNGYVLSTFNGIESSDTIIQSLQYSTMFPKKKTFDMKKSISCVHSVFGMNTGKTGTILRFKRVSNYNEMSAQTAYIIERVNNRDNPRDIIKGLVDELGMKEVDATDKVTTFLSNIEMSSALFSTNRQLISNNPGFPIYVTQEKLSTNVKMEVSGITSLKYIDTLALYLDSFIRISQQPSIIKKDMCDSKSVISSASEPSVIPAITVIEPVIMDKEPLETDNKLMYDVPDEAQTDMMSYLMGMDDDEDDEDDEEYDVDGNGVLGKGLSDDIEDVVPDLNGTRLNNPNPISSRLYEREPKLFIKQEDDEGYSSYSRMCPSALKRQPIILTDAEKKHIDKHHPGSYNESIQYKTSETGATHHYICPRYWSLRDNVSLTEKEVKEKYSDQVIGPKDKVIADGKHIYEFDKSYHRDKKGDYAGTYPGFMTTDSHPNGMCIPCCFKQWDGKRQRELRDQCQAAVGPPKKEVKPVKTTIEADMYINNPDSFPLSIGRYGYLPIPIQRFLNTDNKKCHVSPSDSSIKPNTQCILRLGIELSKKQSFIGVISSVFQEVSKRLHTIKDMKDIIINSLDLDKYVSLHNGALVDTFYVESDVDVKKYSNTRLYAISIGNDRIKKLLLRYIKSYENFINFLKDDEVLIDYTYLWDICCTPDVRLFPKGLNLIIVELDEDDASDNVSIICPPIQYTSKFGDPTRKHVIVIKRQDYYEHVVVLQDTGKKVNITRTFSKLYKNLLPSIEESITFIKKHINSKCTPHESSPKTYTFVQGVSIDTLLEALFRNKCKINSQVMNYNGRIIGIITTNKKGVTGYIPCIPSGILNDDSIDITWIEEYQGIDYATQLKFLLYMDKITSGDIRCKPKIKVINDGLIVAIITETNQLIPVTPIVDTYGSDLEIITDYETMTFDRDITETDTQDLERKDVIRKIHLESSFYYAFRTTVKNLVHLNNNRKMLKQIINLIDSEYQYEDKFKRIEKILKDISKASILFGDYEEEIISNLSEVTMCSYDDERCSTSDNCLLSDGRCLMIIPKKNLVNGKNNTTIYYERLTDEIIRYLDIREFMINKNNIIAPHDLKYNINFDEILIYQGSITKQYFDGLVQSKMNPYVSNTTWETATPKISPLYDNKVDLVYIRGVKCENPTLDKVGHKIRKYFPLGFIEQRFDDRPECSFDILLSICYYEEHMNNFTITDIKQSLIDEYKKYYVEYKFKILSMLKENKKQVIAKKLLGREITFDDLIMRDEYKITHLDIWLFSVRYNLPIIIVWTGEFTETHSNIIITNNSINSKYYFVRMNGNSASYSLILDDERNILIDTSRLTQSFQDEIREQEPLYTLQSVFNDFNREEANKVKKLNAKKFAEQKRKTNRKIVID